MEKWVLARGACEECVYAAAEREWKCSGVGEASHDSVDDVARGGNGNGSCAAVLVVGAAAGAWGGLGNGRAA